MCKLFIGNLLKNKNIAATLGESIAARGILFVAKGLVVITYPIEHIDSLLVIIGIRTPLGMATVFAMHGVQSTEK